MLSGLVDSRLVIPPPPPRHVSRRRLLAALDDAADAALVLLSAGPGSGKTVLLAEWARQTPEHVAWLCPTPDDDDPGRFRALLTAAFGIPPEVAPDPVLAEARPVDFVHWLRGRLPAGRGRLVLAVDDGHVLTSPGIVALLDKLVSCGRPQLHVVLAARHDPPLPLHRYRLAGQLREFRMPQLAMTPGEVREVLAAHQVTLPPPALRALAARTEGWAAGVRLAGMRMEHVRGPAGLVAELSFDYGSAGEYFLAEVLGRLPEPVRRLLVETSFLDTVTAPLAAAVTGLEGAGEMLAGLAHGNWFVIPVDAAGTRFRYHRLFAEVLRDLLGRHGRHRLAELAARAAAFFAEDGDVEQALYWAARAGDSRQAAALLVGGGLCQAFAHHRPVPRAELAGVLPAPARPASPGNGGPPGPHPEIALAAVALRAATGGSAVPAQEATAQEATAQELAQALAAVPLETRQSGPARQTAVLVELMLAMRSADSRAVDHAASRLVGGSSPDGPHSGVLRGAVLLAQASAHFWAGAQDDVDVLLSQALAESERCGLVRVQADVLGMMACVATYRGRPGHADEAALQADRLLRGQPGLRTPTALRLAAVIRSVLRADIPAAARALRHASAPADVGASPGLAAALTLWHATVLALSGKPREAQAALAAGLVDPLPALLRVHRDIVLGEIETHLGHPQEAVKYLDRHLGGGLGAVAAVPSARAHLALGDLEGARQRIRGVLSATGRRFGSYVLAESMLLDARIAQRAGDTARAAEMITNALDVAPDGLVLPFAATGEVFGGLLARHPALAARWPGPPADGPGGGAAPPGPGARDAPALLTQREQAVLSYLATSMTTAEIAAELYLSVNTVKTHLAAIYRKMGTGRRRDAVRRARELELL